MGALDFASGVNFKNFIVAIPKKNRVCKVGYYAVFSNCDVANRFMADPTVQVAWADIVYDDKLPTIRTMYVRDDKRYVRLYPHMFLTAPGYVKAYLLPRAIMAGDGQLTNIQIWTDSARAMPGFIKLDSVPMGLLK
jgi:hypothetical protein